MQTATAKAKKLPLINLLFSTYPLKEVFLRHKVIETHIVIWE